MQKISTKEMTHDEWLEARRIGIGGSDVSAIMGLNAYKSPLSVYLEKIGESPLEDTTSEAAFWGTQLEDVIARHYAEKNGVKIRRNNHILIHPEYPYMIANIDREAYSDTRGRYGVEVKTVGLRNAHLWEDDNVPIPYVLQMQHYMAVTGWDFFVCPALIGGQRYIEREIPRDEAIISTLIEAEGEFMDKVERRIPPAWDGSQQASQILKALYPKAEPGKQIVLPSTVMDSILAHQELDLQVKEAKEVVKDLETKKKAYEQEIAAIMGDAETGIIDGIQVTYKTTERKSYVVEATSYRTLRIKELKEKRVA